MEGFNIHVRAGGNARRNRSHRRGVFRNIEEPQFNFSNNSGMIRARLRGILKRCIMQMVIAGIMLILMMVMTLLITAIEDKAHKNSSKSTKFGLAAPMCFLSVVFFLTWITITYARPYWIMKIVKWLQQVIVLSFMVSTILIILAPLSLTIDSEAAGSYFQSIILMGMIAVFIAICFNGIVWMIIWWNVNEMDLGEEGTRISALDCRKSCEKFNLGSSE